MVILSLGESWSTHTYGPPMYSIKVDDMLRHSTVLVTVRLVTVQSVLRWMLQYKTYHYFNLLESKSNACQKWIHWKPFIVHCLMSFYYRYRQCFDLEGESGIVVRAIGTSVSLVRQCLPMSPLHSDSPIREYVNNHLISISFT